jgi:hypothetical protein
MQQLYGANQMMIDEKDKAWNYNVNMPYQLKLQRAQEKLRRGQMITDAFSGVAIAVGGGAATEGTQSGGGGGGGGEGNAGGLFGMLGSIFSDERLKTDITMMDKGLDVVLNLSPVEFKYVRPLDNDNRTHLGFIAQDVQNVVPEIVKEVDYGQEKRLTIMTNEMIPLLVNSIKELNDRLIAVEKENQWLKDELRKQLA